MMTGFRSSAGRNWRGAFPMRDSASCRRPSTWCKRMRRKRSSRRYSISSEKTAEQESGGSRQMGPLILPHQQLEAAMAFRISGLSAEPFRHLYGLSDAELARRGVKRYVVDERVGY